MTKWIPKRESLQVPLHSSLASMISSAIEDGRLKVGHRLPTHRALADQIGLSVNTVSKAYDILKRQNLIDGQVGRGSYVADITKPEHRPFKLEAERGTTIARELGCEKPRAFVKGGPTARTIVGFAQEHENDLIVIGSRGLGSLEGVLLGSVSHKVTSLAKSPVLVV